MAKTKTRSDFNSLEELEKIWHEEDAIRQYRKTLDALDFIIKEIYEGTCYDLTSISNENVDKSEE